MTSMEEAKIAAMLGAEETPKLNVDDYLAGLDDDGSDASPLDVLRNKSSAGDTIGDTIKDESANDSLGAGAVVRRRDDPRLALV